ncbi:MAG: ZPR1 zinc finger domain-containing protein [Candidatus Woesearchaeota archaeon]|nr:ZPR1 zinc finger domain-containing protein [Candidatus Woesearchaeota archaeon]
MAARKKGDAEKKDKDSKGKKEPDSISEEGEKEILREPAVLPGQICPVCSTNNLTLKEEDMDIPYFGPVSVFSMECSNCEFRKSDIESIEKHDAARYSLEVTSEEDMKIRIVKSSSATVKIPYIGNMEPGEFSEGFVTNVEGLLMKFKDILQGIRDNEDEEDEAKDKAKNMMKKIDRTIWGREKVKIIIEDPEGNSAIISDKAVVEKIGKK